MTALSSLFDTAATVPAAFSARALFLIAPSKPAADPGWPWARSKAAPARRARRLVRTWVMKRVSLACALVRRPGPAVRAGSNSDCVMRDRFGRASPWGDAGGRGLFPEAGEKNAAASGFGGSGRRLQRREVVDDGLHVGRIDRRLVDVNHLVHGLGPL